MSECHNTVEYWRERARVAEAQLESQRKKNASTTRLRQQRDRARLDAYRFRKALEFYAEEENWSARLLTESPAGPASQAEYESGLAWDMGEHARGVLAMSGMPSESWLNGPLTEREVGG